MSLDRSERFLKKVVKSATPKKTKHFYKFDAFSIDVENRLLMRDEQPVAITIKAFDTLLVLVENRQDVLGKDELMEALWPDTVVEENNLNQQISTLRKLLGEGPAGQKYIETIPRRGYRFVAEVTESYGEEPVPLHIVDQPPMKQPTLLSEHSGQKSAALVSPGWKLASFLIVLAAFGGLLYLWFSRLPVIKSVAVLPFKPLPNGSSDVILELGMADSIITRLGNIKELTVRPTSSILSYSSTDIDPVETGKKLRVDAVLQGRYLISGDLIRVTVQAIRVLDGAVLWGATFNERNADLVRLEDSISQRVVASLKLNTTHQERDSLAKSYTANTKAHNLYLKGRYHWYKWTPESWKKAKEYFALAVQEDPTYALAYSGLADAYGVMAFVAPRSEIILEWKVAALKALELDNNLAEAHITMSGLKFFGEWDWRGAEAEVLQALDLSPNNALAHDMYGMIHQVSGRPDESIEEAKRALTIDPLSPYMNTDLGAAYYIARRFDEAIPHFKTALELGPDHADAMYYLSSIYHLRGLHAEAVTLYQKALTVTGDEEMGRDISRAYTTSGYQAALLTWEDRLLKKSRTTSVAPIDLAVLYARLGNNKKTLEYLDKAYQERSSWLIWIGVEPRWDAIRSEGPFTELQKKIEESSQGSVLSGR